MGSTVGWYEWAIGLSFSENLSQPIYWASKQGQGNFRLLVFYWPLGHSRLLRFAVLGIGRGLLLSHGAVKTSAKKQLEA